MSETEWWNAPPGGLEANAWGVPPYDVVAARLLILHGLRAKSGDCLLDLGCGLGRTAREIAAGDQRVVGVDASAAMVQGAVAAVEQGYRERGEFAYPHGIGFMVGNGRDLPEAIRFDHAYSITMFEHIPHSATIWYMEQIRRRLPSGGRFVFTHTPGYDAHAPRHHQCGERETPLQWADDLGFINGVELPLPPALVETGSWCWYKVEKP